MVLNNENFFLKHLEIIIKKTNVHLPTYRIVDRSPCLRNDHFLLHKPNKLVFHKNLFDFFVQFPSTMFKNTLLIDDMFHKSLFNLPFSAIKKKTFYKSHSDANYLFQIVLPYLESLHSSGMRVYKFVELNHFGSITNVLPDDPKYAKLITLCSIECDETFYNKVTLRSLNKKK